MTYWSPEASTAKVRLEAKRTWEQSTWLGGVHVQSVWRGIGASNAACPIRFRRFSNIRPIGDQRRAQVPYGGRTVGQSAAFQRGTANGTGRACLLQRGAGLYLPDHRLRPRQGPTRRCAGLNCRPPAFLQTLTKVPQRGTQGSHCLSCQPPNFLK